MHDLTKLNTIYMLMRMLGVKFSFMLKEVGISVGDMLSLAMLEEPNLGEEALQGGFCLTHYKLVMIELIN